MLLKKNLLHVNINEENIQEKPIYNLCIRFKYMKCEKETQEKAYAIFDYYTIIRYNGFLDYFTYPPYTTEYLLAAFEEMGMEKNIALFKEVSTCYDELPKKENKRFKVFEKNKNTLKDYDEGFQECAKEIEELLKAYILKHQEDFLYAGTLEV